MRPRFEHNNGESLSKENGGLYLAKERLHRDMSLHLHIFTDGSVQENGDTGCACVVPDLKITREYRLNAGVSIFTVELHAILMACLEVHDMPPAPRGVVILTDSQSSLQALAAGGTTNRGEIQAEILRVAHHIIVKGTDLTLMWLPSHTGIRGNELADAAAKAASLEGRPVNLGLSLAEIRGRIRKAAWKARGELPASALRGPWVAAPPREERAPPHNAQETISTQHP